MFEDQLLYAEVSTIVISFSPQIRTILDMYYLDICGCFYWNVCNILGTQVTEERLELWHKFGNLVCWFVLWICHNCSSWTLCNPQVLLGAIWPCSALMSLWLLLVCIHPSTGKSNQSMIDTFTYCKLHILLFLLKSPLPPLSFKLKKKGKRKRNPTELSSSVIDITLSLRLEVRSSIPCS